MISVGIDAKSLSNHLKDALLTEHKDFAEVDSVADAFAKKIGEAFTNHENHCDPLIKIDTDKEEKLLIDYFRQAFLKMKEVGLSVAEMKTQLNANSWNNDFRTRLQASITGPTIKNSWTDEGQNFNSTLKIVTSHIGSISRAATAGAEYTFEFADLNDPAKEPEKPAVPEDAEPPALPETEEAAGEAEKKKDEIEWNWDGYLQMPTQLSGSVQPTNKLGNAFGGSAATELQFGTKSKYLDLGLAVGGSINKPFAEEKAAQQRDSFNAPSSVGDRPPLAPGFIKLEGNTRIHAENGLGVEVRGGFTQARGVPGLGVGGGTMLPAPYEKKSDVDAVKKAGPLFKAASQERTAATLSADIGGGVMGDNLAERIFKDGPTVRRNAWGTNIGLNLPDPFGYWANTPSPIGDPDKVVAALNGSLAEHDLESSWFTTKVEGVSLKELASLAPTKENAKKIELALKRASKYEEATKTDSMKKGFSILADALKIQLEIAKSDLKLSDDTKKIQTELEALGIAKLAHRVKRYTEIRDAAIAKDEGARTDEEKKAVQHGGKWIADGNKALAEALTKAAPLNENLTLAIIKEYYADLRAKEEGARWVLGLTPASVSFTKAKDEANKKWTAGRWAYNVAASLRTPAGSFISSLGTGLSIDPNEGAKKKVTAVNASAGILDTVNLSYTFNPPTKVDATEESDPGVGVFSEEGYPSEYEELIFAALQYFNENESHSLTLSGNAGPINISLTGRMDKNKGNKDYFAALTLSTTFDLVEGAKKVFGD